MRAFLPTLALVGSLSFAAPAASALPVPVSPDEARFLELASPLKLEPAMPALVVRVAEGLLGRPYQAHMLDSWEGSPEQEPLVARLDAFDCVTLVETAVAAARTVAGEKTGWSGFQAELEKLRYRDGKRVGYASRLHYFSEWIADNERRGAVLDLTAALGGEPDRRPLRFMTSHREAYKKLQDDRAYQQLLAAEKDLAGLPRYVIPKSKVTPILPMLQNGDVVAIATNIEGLDVVHTGLVYRKADGTVHLLHAPEPGASVQVSSKPLVDYLQAYKVYTGIMVARPLPPSR